MNVNPYLLLAVAIAIELVGTSALKASDGFANRGFGVLFVAAYVVSFYLLSITLRSLPLGFVYAVWAGVGTVGAAVIGVLIWKEVLDPPRAIGVGLVVAGVVVLNLGGVQ